jgi:hypothetical protein
VTILWLFFTINISIIAVMQRIFLTYTKRDASKEFYRFTPELLDLIKKYQNNGDIVDFSMDDSDSMVLKYTLTYFDNISKEKFRSEGIVINYADERDAHHRDNAIEMEAQEFYVD